MPQALGVYRFKSFREFQHLLIRLLNALNVRLRAEVEMEPP